VSKTFSSHPSSNANIIEKGKEERKIRIERQEGGLFIAGGF
jgi:hypothetical protein